MKANNLLTALTIVAISIQAESLHALTLPDYSSCNTTGQSPCLLVTNSGNGPSLLGETTVTILGPTFPYFNTNNVAVYGVGYNDANGVIGFSTGRGNGVEGQTSTGVGVWGLATGTGNFAAVYGQNAAGGYGVAGDSGSVAVYGRSSGAQGVFGESSCGGGGTCIGVYGTSTNGNGVWGNTSSTTNAAVVGVAPTGGYAFWGNGNLYITGSTAWKAGGGSWSATSDRRVKRDVKSLDQGLPELLQVQPVRFHYNGLGGTVDDGKEYVGVVAQDLEQVIPSMVSVRQAKLHPTDARSSEIKQVDPSNFTYLLINAVKEQQKMMERQEARIEALERERREVTSSATSHQAVATYFLVGLLPVGVVIGSRRRKRT